jgi:competence/damage-inducible protein CinA-like protein
MDVARKSVIVCVGDELLGGVIVNTNASMISETMLTVGVPVAWQLVVGDELDDIVDAIARASKDASVVIITGGLGPTADDKTRDAIAMLLGGGLVRDESIVEDIRQRFRNWGREMPESNAKQADIPAGATAIPNPWGTAPGIRAEYEGAVLYAIPGVPGEARRMLSEQILPDIGEGAMIRARVLHCVGISESGLADLFPDISIAENPRMAYLPGGGEIKLRFVAVGTTESECIGLLDEAEATVRDRAGAYVYGVDNASLEAFVGAELREKGLTVGTAESCTAGMLAARIASVPGASDYLVGSIVSYADRVKVESLDVDPSLLLEHGAVSDEVAQAMAAGARSKLRCDIAMAITCVAGPGPQGDIPAGQLYLALASKDGVVSRGARVPGDRDQVRQFATTYALAMLKAHLESR